MDQPVQDAAQISQAVDTLARSILAKRVKDHENKPERLRKLDQLKQQFDALMQAHQACQDAGQLPPLTLNARQLDKDLSTGLEIVERHGQSYVLLPLVGSLRVATREAQQTQATGEASNASPAGKPGNNKTKKKNKIPCSYCHKSGHTRAHCQEKLLGSGSRS